MDDENRMGTGLVIFFFVLQYHSISNLVCGAPLAPALYVFGDSLFDSGNNNLLPTLAKADFKPYGVNFVKGDTGRFSNGRLVPDIIAEFLGLPYPPPYISFRRPRPVTGLNYASASCGILPETGKYSGKCLDLDEQIDLFQHTVKSTLPWHFRNPNGLKEYLSKSIFVVCIGSNDYMSNYLKPDRHDTNKRYTPGAFTHLLLDNLSRHFERLYNIGARKVLMFEIGPIGCTPSIAKKNKHNGKCDEEPNQLVAYFNNKLHAMLQNLTSTLPNSIFVPAQAHWLGYDAIMNPSKYGLIDSSNPCCFTWSNGTSACIPKLSPCPNPNQHFFFDGYHLTESVYSVLASHCINDKSVCSPTLNELVLM